MTDCRHHLWDGKLAMELMDCVGVPEFFVTAIGKTEHAGGGCVRIYCCIQRGDVLLPQLTIVVPAASLLVATKQAERAARDVFKGEIVTRL